VPGLAAATGPATEAAAITGQKQTHGARLGLPNH
jgi:hypothetical protein